MKHLCRISFSVFILLFSAKIAFATGWKEVKATGKGEITVCYYNSDNFISDVSGELKGIEHDLFIEFSKYLQTRGYDVAVNFVKAESFTKLYDNIKNGQTGVFGACSFSITESRMDEVGFSPKYMPDIEVLICSQNLPVVSGKQEFLKAFSKATALSVPQTTFEKDIEQLKMLMHDLNVEEVNLASTVRERIAKEPDLFGYIELPTYVKTIKEGLRLKRQNVFKVERNGYGIIFPKTSDWNDPINDFFHTDEFKVLMNNIIRKHLGDDVQELVWNIAEDIELGDNKEIALLTKEREIQSLEIEKQELLIGRHQAQQNLWIGGAVLATLMLLTVLYGYKVKKAANSKLQEQNTKIENQRNDILIQKEIIETKNKDITDSINYAKKIQEAMLPSESFLERNFSDHFVLFQPRDIVSGDFYWFTEQGDFCIIVLADCTGHGVPGAFMSMMGCNFLSQIVTDHAITSTSEAMKMLDKKVRLALKNENKSAGDGMDMVFLAYNIKTRELEYSGGMNSIYLLRNKELFRHKGDRFAIGGKDDEEKNFAKEIIQLVEGDIIYAFTDGFQDQFGGPKGKKFRQKQLLELLAANAGKPLNEQKQMLQREILDWMGKHEQVDDISVLGIKI